MASSEHIGSGPGVRLLGGIFRTLRRLRLEEIAPAVVAQIAHALAAASPAPLTHLSLTACAGTDITRQHVLQLADALRHAPELRVLYVHGLRHALPEVITSIADGAPGLWALTLGHRASIYDSEDKRGVQWRAPAHEYAARLSVQGELRHLGLNMNVQAAVYSPLGMLGMERRATMEATTNCQDALGGDEGLGDAEESAWTGVVDTSVSDNEGYPSDYLAKDVARLTAAMFAAHAPTLRTVFLGGEDDFMQSPVHAFDREEAEQIVVREQLSSQEADFVRRCDAGGASWYFDRKEAGSPFRQVIVSCSAFEFCLAMLRGERTATVPLNPVSIFPRLLLVLELRDLGKPRGPNPYHLPCLHPPTAMDSDDETTHIYLSRKIDNTGLVAEWPDHCRREPPLKLHAEEIDDILQHHYTSCFDARDAARKARSAPNNDAEVIAKEEAEALRYADETCVSLVGIWQTRCFFDTLAGFHKGDLDLSGRHLSRYKILQERLIAMMFDLSSLSGKYKISTRMTTEWDIMQMKEVPCEVPAYEFDPPGLWDDFEAKWHIGPSINFGVLTSYIKDFFGLTQRQQLRLQYLCLVDLPPEILDHIMSLSPVHDRRRWSMTCKLLREHALAKSYEIFDYRLSLYETDFDIEAHPDDEGYDDEVAAFVQKVALSQRDALRKRMRRVAKRQDVLSKIRVLRFSEDWTSDAWRWSGRSYTDFISPLIHALNTHIRISPLAELTYRTRYLYAPTWQAIVQSSSLRTLVLCTTLPVHPNWTHARNVVNLDLMLSQATRPNFLWDIITACPSALSVRVQGSSEHGIYIPITVFSPRAHNPLKHIRRLDLQDLIAESLLVLATAIEAVGCIPLTHLAVSTAKSHIKKDIAVVLVRSLRRAEHLLVLRIDGLQYAKPDILALIGECVPHIEALVLQHQASKYFKNRAAYWPCPAHEYAPCLSAFPHLRHLGLNMRIFDALYTPHAVTYLESDYVGAEDWYEKAIAEWRREDPSKHDMDEHPRSIDHISTNAARATVRLFAIHGVALRTVSLHNADLSLPFFAMGIDRDGEGRPILRDKFEDDEREEAGYAVGSLIHSKWMFDECQTRDVLDL